MCASDTSRGFYDDHFPSEPTAQRKEDDVPFTMIFQGAQEAGTVVIFASQRSAKGIGFEVVVTEIRVHYELQMKASYSIAVATLVSLCQKSNLWRNRCWFCSVLAILALNLEFMMPTESIPRSDQTQSLVRILPQALRWNNSGNM